MGIRRGQKGFWVVLTLALLPGSAWTGTPAVARTNGGETPAPPKPDLLVCRLKAGDEDCYQLYKDCRAKGFFFNSTSSGTVRVCHPMDCDLLAQRVAEARRDVLALDGKERSVDTATPACHGYQLTTPEGTVTACTASQRKGSRVLFELYQDLGAICAAGPNAKEDPL